VHADRRLDKDIMLVLEAIRNGDFI